MDFYFAAFLDPSTIGLRVKNIGGTRLPDEPEKLAFITYSLPVG